MTRVSADRFASELPSVGDAVRAAADYEAALEAINRIALQTLGDADAAQRPGALREGERDYRVAGAFLITPDRRYNMLCGNIGFPREQRRLMIPLEWNDPGWVVANEKPLLVANTDQHAQFRQFLKSSRMGSSIYAPFFARVGGRIAMAGQVVAASQARDTYALEDLERLRVLASLAGLAHSLHDGASWLNADYPAPDAWRAETHARLDAPPKESTP